MNKLIIASYFIVSFFLFGNVEIGVVPDKDVIKVVQEVEYAQFENAIVHAKEMISNYPNSPEGRIILSFVYTTFMNDYKTVCYSDEFYRLFYESDKMLSELKKNGCSNPYMYFYHGIILCYYGIMQFRNGSIFSAFLNGLKGIDRLEYCTDKNSDELIVDSYLGLSQFLYYKSFYSKYYSWMPGVKSDLELSYEYLELVKKYGKFMANEAELAEFTMRINDDNLDENYSNRLISLMKSHPDHIFLHYKLLDYYIYMQMWSNAISTAEETIYILKNEKLSGSGAYLEIYYKQAFSFFKFGDFDKALITLQKIPANIDLDDWYANKDQLKKVDDLVDELESIKKSKIE